MRRGEQDALGVDGELDDRDTARVGPNILLTVQNPRHRRSDAKELAAATTHGEPTPKINARRWLDLYSGSA